MRKEKKACRNIEGKREKKKSVELTKDEIRAEIKKRFSDDKVFIKKHNEIYTKLLSQNEAKKKKKVIEVIEKETPEHEVSLPKDLEPFLKEISLDIAKWLIERGGGKIRIENQPEYYQDMLMLEGDIKNIAALWKFTNKYLLNDDIARREVVFIATRLFHLGAAMVFNQCSEHFAVAEKGLKFIHSPDTLRKEAKEKALQRKKELISQGKSPTAANAIVQSEFEDENNKELNKYKDLFKNYGTSNWKMFLQSEKTESF